MSPELVHERHHLAHAARAGRMPERDGPAVHAAHPAPLRLAEPSDQARTAAAEGLVHLHEVDVAEREAEQYVTLDEVDDKGTTSMAAG